MGEPTRAVTEQEDPTGDAELNFGIGPDGPSGGMKVPARNASDLFLVVVVLVIAFGPAAMFHFANVTSTPWWAATTIVFVQIASALAILYTRLKEKPQS